MSFPEPNSLLEVRGHLDSYDFHQTGRGKGDYTTIIALQEGRRLWTRAIAKGNAEALLRERGSEIRYYVDPKSTNVPMDGDAVKAYGLWINGRQQQSVNESISDDKVAAHIYLPAVGISCIVVAGFFYRRNKAKYLRNA